MTCSILKPTAAIPPSAAARFAAGDLSPPYRVSPLSSCCTARLCVVLAIYLQPLIFRLAGNYPLRLPHAFLGWLLLYAVTTLVYSFYFKRKLLLDVFILSQLYTVRILAGSATTNVAVSTWLAGLVSSSSSRWPSSRQPVSSKACAKRGTAVSNGRGYFVSDLEQLRALGTGAAYAGVIIMTLYIRDPAYASALRPSLSALAGHTGVAAMAQPGLVMRASRGEMHDDPVVWALTGQAQPPPRPAHGHHHLARRQRNRPALVILF